MSGFLTCAEVAEELRVSVRTVTRMIDRGDIAAIRLPGGRLRVSQAALAEHLDAWTTSNPTEAYAGPVDAGGPATLTRPGPDTGTGGSNA